MIPLRRRRLAARDRRFCVTVAVGMRWGLNFVVVLGLYFIMYVGGTALTGKIEGGRYYVG